jgi:hypothetical protein
MTAETGREDTDEALSTERSITDKREKASDDALDEWRASHAGDELRGAVEPTSSRHWLVIVNWTMIVFVVLWLAVITQQVILSTSRNADTAKQIGEINQRQIETVREQNNAQLCAQHDIVIAVRKIGTKLGLPVEDIVPPNVDGIDCP